MKRHYVYIERSQLLIAHLIRFYIVKNNTHAINEFYSYLTLSNINRFHVL